MEIDCRPYTREWGQFLPTMTKDEYKASMYDLKCKEVASLKKEVAELKMKV